MTHILIIEDDLLVALDVEGCLEEMGAVSTALASSEDRAVKMALERRPDLMTSDVRLAQGHGPEAVRRIVEHYGPIPTLYITGNPEAVKKDHPDAQILVKPYRWADLGDAAKALGLAGSAA